MKIKGLNKRSKFWLEVDCCRGRKMRAQLFPHKTAASKNKSFLNEKIMKFVLKIKEGVSAVKRMMLGREKRL